MNANCGTWCREVVLYTLFKGMQCKLPLCKLQIILFTFTCLKFQPWTMNLFKSGTKVISWSNPFRLSIFIPESHRMYYLLFLLGFPREFRTKAVKNYCPPRQRVVTGECNETIFMRQTMRGLPTLLSTCTTQRQTFRCISTEVVKMLIE